MLPGPYSFAEELQMKLIIEELPCFWFYDERKFIDEEVRDHAWIIVSALTHFRSVNPRPWQLISDDHKHHMSK